MKMRSKAAVQMFATATDVRKESCSPNVSNCDERRMPKNVPAKSTPRPVIYWSDGGSSQWHQQWHAWAVTWSRNMTLYGDMHWCNRRQRRKFPEQWITSAGLRVRLARLPHGRRRQAPIQSIASSNVGEWLTV